MISDFGLQDSRYPCLTIIPKFHQSNNPLIHSSIIPKFDHSSTPTLHDSITPPLSAVGGCASGAHHSTLPPHFTFTFIPECKLSDGLKTTLSPAESPDNTLTSVPIASPVSTDTSVTTSSFTTNAVFL